MSTVIDISLEMCLGKQQSHKSLKEKDMGSGTRSVTVQETAVVPTCRRRCGATSKDGKQMATAKNSDWCSGTTRLEEVVVVLLFLSPTSTHRNKTYFCMNIQNQGSI